MMALVKCEHGLDVKQRCFSCLEEAVAARDRIIARLVDVSPPAVEWDEEDAALAGMAPPSQWDARIATLETALAAMTERAEKAAAEERMGSDALRDEMAIHDGAKTDLAAVTERAEKAEGHVAKLVETLDEVRKVARIVSQNDARIDRIRALLAESGRLIAAFPIVTKVATSPPPAEPFDPAAWLAPDDSRPMLPFVPHAEYAALDDDARALVACAHAAAEKLVPCLEKAALVDAAKRLGLVLAGGEPGYWQSAYAMLRAQTIRCLGCGGITRLVDCHTGHTIVDTRSRTRSDEQRRINVADMLAGINRASEARADALEAELRATRRERNVDHAQLRAVSGALCDAGDVVVEPYADGVRELTRQRNEYRDRLPVDGSHLPSIVDLLEDEVAKLRAQLAATGECKGRHGPRNA